MPIIRQILSEKGDSTWSVRESTIVYDALKLMDDKNIGSVLVLNPDGNLVGIFSERDYARKVVLRGKRSAETHIHEVMSVRPTTVDPDTPIETCIQIMTESRMRHLPVMEEGRLMGLVSIGDLVKAIIRNQREMIQDMEAYIQGRTGN